MANRNYYHLMLSLPGIAPTDSRVEDILNKATDWYRYADNCWLLYTGRDASKWYARLKPLVTAHNGNVLIIHVDPTDRQGWMPRELWQWLRKAQASHA